MSAVYIFTGHYGSGKTETAVNFALALAGRPGSRVGLVDLDIVNPFFRAADARALLEAAGVRVETPLYANTNVDIPALTGSMGALIEDPAYDVVLDVGGDDLGAKAVGRYSEEIRARTHYRFFVINARRPFTETVESASRIYDDVQASACVPCYGIVNNTNLLEETTAQVIADGLPLVQALAERKNVPLCFHAVEERLIPSVLALHNPLLRRDNILAVRRTVRRLF